MADIPGTINEVEVEFASTVNKDVVQSMIDGLNHCIKKEIATGHILNKIYISSASDSHVSPSRHAQKKAVDISRINGTKMSEGYPGNSSVTAIVKAIQDTFEGYSGRRENFGPHVKKKHGQSYDVSGHADHIHLSVD